MEIRVKKYVLRTSAMWHGQHDCYMQERQTDRAGYGR
jgi:hypothetical protein